MNHGESVSLTFAPPVAPPRSWLHLPSRSFEKPLKGGRALTPAASRRASTNQKRAALPPSLHNKRGENRWEKTPQLRESFCFPRAFSDGFRRGNRRSVVRGGWHSQASVVAKMVVVANFEFP